MCRHGVVGPQIPGGLPHLGPAPCVPATHSALRSHRCGNRVVGDLGLCALWTHPLVGANPVDKSAFLTDSIIKDPLFTLVPIFARAPSLRCQPPLLVGAAGMWGVLFAGNEMASAPDLCCRLLLDSLGALIVIHNPIHNPPPLLFWPRWGRLRVVSRRRRSARPCCLHPPSPSSLIFFLKMNVRIAG